MRTQQEIATARHMCAAHEAHLSQSPGQSLVLYGMRCALGLLRHKLPTDKLGWYALLTKIVNSWQPPEVNAWPHCKHGLEVDRTLKTTLELTTFRGMATQYQNGWPDMPPNYSFILAGVRSALAWVLELPSGGRAMENLLAGSQLTPVIAPFDRGTPKLIGIDNI